MQASENIDFDQKSNFYISFLCIFDMIYLYNINNNASGNTRYLLYLHVQK